MNLKHSLCWLFGLLLCQSLVAQQAPGFSNLRVHALPLRNGFQVLDMASVAQPLVSITDSVSGKAINPAFVRVQNNLIRLDSAAIRAEMPDCRMVLVQYRVLPLNLGAARFRLDSSVMRRYVANDAIEFDFSPFEAPEKPWESGGLTSAGVYTRGLSFGNSQNLVFNSNLNLQLNGRLGNDLEIQAALSDNSIPLQPDGTTRQIQEFDRIFIQIKRKTTTLTAGDFDLTRPNGYFSNYFKRLQGGMVSGSEIFKIGKQNDTLQYRVAAAVSKGKFARQVVQGVEGNQGPYRLFGAEGERFIIVLAGTEKVFIDGQQLRRGLGDDYVIDYNLGEVTFTSRRLITKDSRIIIEFEYAVQTFLRSTLAANMDWRLKNTHLYFNLYSEQDSRSSSGAQDLSDTERRKLAEVGDNLRNAYASGIDTLADFDPARIQYKTVDTLICGLSQTILIYTTNPDSARYTARFTELSNGQGNYVLALSSANGRVYKWVAPDPLTCAPRGNFEPIVRLIAPEKRQLYTAGADVRVRKRGRMQAEMALSTRDYNRFSPLGNQDNNGLAGFVNYSQRFEQKDKPWQAETNLAGEYTSRNFSPLNPYRPSEFVRDWNIAALTDTSSEQLARGGLKLKYKNWGAARYELAAFRRGNVYTGTRHFSQLDLKKSGFDVLAEANLLQTTGLLEDTRFSRPKANLSYTFSARDSTSRKSLFTLGVYAEQEKNARRTIAADTLNGASFQYDLVRAYLQTPEKTEAWQFGASVSRRHDYAPRPSSFSLATVADEMSVNGQWNNQGSSAPTRHQLSWNMTLRKLAVEAPELTKAEPQNSYLGRVDYNINALKNAVNLSTGYEIGSGQSPKLEFNYLHVNPGEGQFTWIDRNRDSILQVDEMEVAVFLDQADYVRVAVTTPDYVRTNNVLLSQNLRLEPRLLWASSRRGWRFYASKLATQHTLQINRRTFADAQGISPWNPFQFSIADTALANLSASLRNVLFVNRANPQWDASLAQSDNQNQVVLTTGFEKRRNADWTLHGRLNLGTRWSADADLVRGQKTSSNESFSTRDFAIQSWQASPGLNWLPNRNFRLAGRMKWQDSQNTLQGQESAKRLEWNLEMTWNPAMQQKQGFRASSSLRAKTTFADIKYNGTANSSVAFVMLEGLQDGRNFLWSLTLDHQLSKNLQLNISYEGRKTGENRIVHVGRAQIRAVL